MPSDRMIAGNLITDDDPLPVQITNLTIAQETQARTATADGTGTGTISVPASGSVSVPVTSANANHIVVLPEDVAFTTVVLEVIATGYELRSHDPATVGINDGRGANAESAIPANTVTVCLGSSDGLNWRCTDQAANGSVVTTEVAAA